jgi:hypothetical protein
MICTRTVTVDQGTQVLRHVLVHGIQVFQGRWGVILGVLSAHPSQRHVAYEASIANHSLTQAALCLMMIVLLR